MRYRPALFKDLGPSRPLAAMRSVQTSALQGPTLRPNAVARKMQLKVRAQKSAPKASN